MEESQTSDSGVTVVPYRPEYADAFARLNREWIEAHFELEDADRAIFNDPYGSIVAPGGQIFFVMEGGAIRGTCAVIRHGPEDFEIAKMAVAREARGRGFGDRLMLAARDFAASQGARRMIIVSNTVLGPAIRLYEKHGFAAVPLQGDQRYRRANIRLERALGTNDERGGTGERRTGP
jgi:putative acetyltransferase